MTRMLMFLVSALAVATAAPDDGATPSSVLVNVNGEPLTRGQADREVELRIGAAEQARLDPARLRMLRDQTRQLVVEQFATRQALLAEAERQGIEAVPSAVEKRWKDARKGDTGPWSPEDMLRIRLIGLDRTRDDVVAGVRIGALLKSVMDAPVEVGEADIEAYRAKHADTLDLPAKAQVKQIFLPVEENAGAEGKAAKRREIDAVRARLLQGESFADMPGAVRGGAALPVRRDEMALLPSLADLIFSIPTNTVSPVFETDYGYHLVQVISRREAGTPAAAEWMPAVEREKQADRLRRFVEDVRRRSESESRGRQP
jgi:parvulin-like peptidyl-prolyl isomerase